MNTKTSVKYVVGAIASVITVVFVLNEYSIYKRKLNYASGKLNSETNKSVVLTSLMEKKEIVKSEDLNFDWDNFSIQLEEFNKKHTSKKHTYYFEANKDIRITTNNKAKIVIPFNALNIDTLSKEKIRVEVTEYLSKDEILFAGLTTLSNGKWLESAGMFEINCFQNDKQLQLKRGKYAELTVPKDVPDGFYIFNAQNANEQLNWELSGLGKKSKKRRRLQGNVDFANGMDVKTMQVFINKPHKNPYEIFVPSNDSLISFIKYFEQNFNVPKSMYQFCEKTDYILNYTFLLDTLNGNIKAIFPNNANRADFPEKYLSAFVKNLPPLVFIKNKIDDKQPKNALNNYCLTISSKKEYKYDTINRGNDSLAVFISPKTKSYLEVLFNGKKNIHKKEDKAEYQNHWESESNESTFVIEKLGIINIDQFLKIPGERTNVSINFFTQVNNIVIIPANLNTFLPAAIFTKSGAIFRELPINKEYFIVLQKISEDKILHLDKEIKPNSDLDLTTKDFKPIKASDLSLLLSSKRTQPQI